VNRDNTVSFRNLTLQIEPVRWRCTLAGCSVIVHQHLDGTLSLGYGPHAFGRYDERGGPILNPKLAAGKAVEKTRGGKVQKPTFPLCGFSTAFRAAIFSAPSQAAISWAISTGHLFC